jgi:hypothetical protein
LREWFVRGEAKAATAGGVGEIDVGVKKFCDVGGVGAHAKEHGDGFVDGSGRKLGKPGIADALGSEPRDGKRERSGELTADVLKERGVESVGARGGVKVDLDGSNAGDGLQVGDFCGEESALCIGKFGE